jgi:hypothetical protein
MYKLEMTLKEISTAKRRRQTLLRRLAAVGPMMRGSIVTNGQKHRQPYFSVNKDKRTHLIYLGDRRLTSAKAMVDNYKKLVLIVEELTMINMALLKNDSID